MCDIAMDSKSLRPLNEVADSGNVSTHTQSFNDRLMLCNKEIPS